ncbi:uncharacterized protein LOC115326622, partial [Ixodes scapularis]|uniref:uncharacterized protein LOC115326622 n=1 Tax=Ixodes scapularis TaxID=6945 RepID=UPI001A9E6C75
VAACLNYQVTSSGVVFHKFPCDIARLNVWTDIVCRWNSGKPWSPNSRTIICSDHFLRECYQRDLRLLCDAGFSSKYARLKPDAVPSILDPGSSPSETADGLTPDAVSPYLVPRSSPPQRADGSCVNPRRTGGGDHCSSSTVSRDNGLPMVNTWDDASEAPTYESSPDAPVAREEPVGQNQDNAVCLSQSGDQASTRGPGCNRSTAASCDTVSATTGIDGHSGPHLEPPICHICMWVVTRGTPTLYADKAVQAFEKLCQTSTENPALPIFLAPSETSNTDFMDFDEDMCPEPNLLDECYRPDNSFNFDDEPDSSDTSICSKDSVDSDGGTDVEYVSTITLKKPELNFMSRIKLGLPI